MLAGLAVIYIGGLLSVSVYAGSFQAAILQGVVPFVLADIVKAVMAAMLLPTAWRFLSTPKS
jgi:biotin transport system substrate-specific component